jgi:glycine/D-amino acid oxidase-like deaminating enzyme
MALRALEIWQNFDDVIGGEAGFVQTGFMLAAGEEGIDELKANIVLQQKVGIDTRFITPAEMRELEPEISTDGLAGAAYEPGSGYADPSAATTAIAERAKDLGAILMLNTRVIALKATGSRVAGLVTDKGELVAGTIILAAGPWTPHLTRTIGLHLPIETSRHEVAVYKKPSTFSRHTVLGDFKEEVYLRPETGDLMLVGSIEDIEKSVDPDNYNEKIDFDTIADFAEKVARRYPVMSAGVSAGGWASLYDITPDWHHIMGPLPGIDGLYCTAGSSGHGFKLGPVIGEMMAALIINGPKPDADINIFSYDRFAEKKLITGQYEQSIVG